MTTIAYTDVNLTDTDKKEYERQRSAYFKGTIAVSVILGTFALGLFLLAVFSEKGRSILANDMRPFTVTFIAGTIILVSLLVIQIVTFKPTPLSKKTYDPMSCPDYWKLQALTDADQTTANIPQDLRYLTKYKCVNDGTGAVPKSGGSAYTGASGAKARTWPNATNAGMATVCPKNASGALTEMCTSSTSKAASKTLRDLAIRISASNTLGAGATLDANIACNEVYPSLLADADAKNFPDNPNRVRCQYAKICGIPWSSACPMPLDADV